jgi:DNA-binding Lrp family transcriptional regulator
MAYRELDQRILTHIAQNPGVNAADVAHNLGVPATTVNKHVKNLQVQHKIVRGLNVSTEYRKQLFKSFIFINSRFSGESPEEGGERDYQQQLVQSIKNQFQRAPYAGYLFMENIEIVLGAEFDIILILLASDISPIGLFVTKFLRPHRYVEKTQTVTVWPTQSKSDEGEATDPTQQGATTALRTDSSAENDGTSDADPVDREGQ